MSTSPHPLPHVGLNIASAGESLYGDESTIGEWERQRAATLDWFASALGLPGAAYERAPTSYFRGGKVPEPYRTTAVVGEPISEIES